MSPPPLLVSSLLISRSVTLAIEVNTIDHRSHRIRYAIRWSLLVLHFIGFVPLRLFILFLLLIGLLLQRQKLRNSSIRPQPYNNPISGASTSPPTRAPYFGLHPDPTQTLDLLRHWRRAPAMMRVHAPPRSRGNGPTASMREGAREKCLGGE